MAGTPPWSIRAGAAVDGTAPSPLLPHEARPISTGHPIPPGALAVVPLEHGIVTAGASAGAGPADAAPSMLAFADGPGRSFAQGAHIRRAGEEASAGAVLLEAGSVLTPPRVGLAAIAGMDALPVAALVRVCIAVLGDEVIRRGRPGPGQARDAFGPQLPYLLQSMGARAVATRHVADRVERTTQALLAEEVDVVLATGGTSHGAPDHVRAALRDLGAELALDGVAMRPGRPAMVALLEDRVVLCLPGNPLAAMVSLLVLGSALLDGMLGRKLPALPDVRLGADVANRRDDDLIVCYRDCPDGAVPVAHQGSAMMRGLAEADGLLVIPPGGMTRGTRPMALALPWHPR